MVPKAQSPIRTSAVLGGQLTLEVGVDVVALWRRLGVMPPWRGLGARVGAVRASCQERAKPRSFRMGSAGIISIRFSKRNTTSFCPGLSPIARRVDDQWRLESYSSGADSVRVAIRRLVQPAV